MIHGYQRIDAGTFLITVDACDDGVMVGRYYYPAGDEMGSYRGIVQLLTKLHRCMEFEEAPQAFHAVRTFFPVYTFPADSGDGSFPAAGKTATFSLRVMFRRNASWQGTLVWLEEKQSQSFRSVLEMIMLMDNAVESRKMPLIPLQEENTRMGIAK